MKKYYQDDKTSVLFHVDAASYSPQARIQEGQGSCFSSYLFMIREEFLKEQNLVVDGIVPIGTVVHTRTGNEVVVDATAQQTLVQVLVHLQKEIALTAIKDDGQVAVLNLVYLVDDRMLVPAFLVGGKFAQLPAHLPVLRERPDVNATTGTTCRTKHFLVPEGIPQGTVTAHAQARNGPSLPRGHRPIMTVGILYQLGRDKRLVAVGRIQRTVPIPTVLSVGANKIMPFSSAMRGSSGFIVIHDLASPPYPCSR